MITLLVILTGVAACLLVGLRKANKEKNELATEIRYLYQIRYLERDDHDLEVATLNQRISDMETNQENNK